MAMFLHWMAKMELPKLATALDVSATVLDLLSQVLT
jgi:hypothetical protein